MVFVDRKKELEKLESLLKLRLSGTKTFVLVYGLRRVGKSTLVEKFLEGKVGVYIDCSSMVSGSDIFSAVFSSLEELGVSRNILDRYRGLYDTPLDDDFRMLEYAFELLNDACAEFDYIVVVFDELHGFIENYSKLRGRNAEISRQRLLWKLRELLQRSNNSIFIVIITSAGFLFEEYSKADRAFLELFHRLEIKPLDMPSSQELAKKLLESMGIGYTEVAVEKLAEFSGGVPKILEILVGLFAGESRIDQKEVVNRVKQALVRGEFDEFFESYLNFVASYMKWDKTTILRVLKCLSEGKRPREISNLTRLRYNTILNILSDLRRVGVITRSNNISYPLLREWLLAGRHPPTGRRRIDLLMQSLGITYESYIRELLGSIRRRIIIEGEEYFFGTTNRLVIDPIDRIEAGEKMDFIAHQTNCEMIVGEVKIGQITKSEITKLLKRARKYGKAKVIAIAKDADPLAIAEAVRKGVVIMSHEAIRLIAKKLGKTPIDLSQ